MNKRHAEARKRELQVLELFATTKNDAPYEFASTLGMSESGVRSLLERLVAKGLVSKSVGELRTRWDGPAANLNIQVAHYYITLAGREFLASAKTMGLAEIKCPRHADVSLASKNACCPKCEAELDSAIMHTINETREPAPMIEIAPTRPFSAADKLGFVISDIEHAIGFMTRDSIQHTPLWSALQSAHRNALETLAKLNAPVCPFCQHKVHDNPTNGSVQCPKCENFFNV
jgi:DNA-binding CsgD family transcriptional regulator